MLKKKKKIHETRNQCFLLGSLPCSVISFLLIRAACLTVSLMPEILNDQSISEILKPHNNVTLLIGMAIAGPPAQAILLGKNET